MHTIKKHILAFLGIGLFLTPSFSAPLPKDYFVPVAQNVKVRVVYVPAKSLHNPQKVVVYLPGRASFFEKSKDFSNIMTGHEAVPETGQLLKEPYDFWSLDFRGQGKSDGRLAERDQRSHIDTFETYIKDVHAVLSQIILPYYRNKEIEIYLIGASMGGHIALRYAQEYATTPEFSKIKKLLLISPMDNFKTDPFPRWVAWILVKGARLLGYGDRYAFGYGDLDLSKADFSKFKGHHNEKDFHETNAFLRDHPELITSGPTFGWAVAAFDSEAKLKNLREIPVKTSVFLAGQDNTLDSPKSRAFFEGKATVYYYEKAFHNLLKETPEYAPGFYPDLIKELTS